MVNPGAFRGLRKEFLMAEKDNYAAGMEGGFAADALAQIQRRYFKRFPVELGHFEDPTPEHLASVDDNAPDPEPEEPDPEKLTPEAYLKAREQADHRREVIRFRKAQIKRWLAYQYMKDQDLDPKESGANNPFHSLIFAITGKEAGRPHRRTAVNVWRKTQRESIEARVKELAITRSVTKDRLAALRDKVARDTFNNLPASEQEHWKQQAVIESDFALEEWKKTMLSEPPNAVKDYQIAIQGLVRISKPFLDFVCKATGWKASLIAGGPEPAQEGRLNVISIHSGTTPGDMKLNWGRAQRTRFKKDVVSCFGDFLKMCYTPEECRARALASSEGFEGLVEEECHEEGVDLDLVDLADPASNPATTTTNRPSLPLVSSSTPFGLSTAHNIPPNASRKAALYGFGRKGPPYQRVPPVRKNPSNIDPSKKPVSQVTAVSRPVTSAMRQSALQTPRGTPEVPPFLSATPPQARSPTVSAPVSSGPAPPVLCGGTTAALPRDSTPSPARGLTPLPSRNLTPVPSRGSISPLSVGQPPDTSPLSPYQPRTATSSQTEGVGRRAKVRKGKKRGRTRENSSPGDEDAHPRKKLRSHRNTVSTNDASLSNATTASESSGPGVTSPKSKSMEQTGERQQASKAVTSKVLPPKKRRKSTGTWIVSDDEGGWIDQDGNPCDPPSNYKYL